MPLRPSRMPVKMPRTLLRMLPRMLRMPLKMPRRKETRREVMPRPPTVKPQLEVLHHQLLHQLSFRKRELMDLDFQTAPVLKPMLNLLMINLTSSSPTALLHKVDHINQTLKVFSPKLRAPTDSDFQTALVLRLMSNSLTTNLTSSSLPALPHKVDHIN